MSNPRKAIISNCEKKFLTKNLSEHNRLDGRSFDEFRDLNIEFGKDWGCCVVSLGKTKVVAQVSCEIQQPKSSRPSEGMLNINIELNPIADPHFEIGRQSKLSVQLNRQLEKCLKYSKAVDLESLCIKMNEKVWSLRVDVNVINHEGNILDCASVAALTALAHFRRPDVTSDGEEFTIYSYKQRDPIPTVLHHYPVCTTYSIFNGGEFILADPTLLEEGVSDAMLTIGFNAYKELCGLHSGQVTPDLIIKTANKAASRATIIINKIKEAVENDNLKRQENQTYGFHIIDNADVPVEPMEDLSVCLDRWTNVNVNKKNRKKKAAKTDSNDVPTTQPEIESIGKGTAVLLPNECGDNQQIWLVSSSDDEEEMIVSHKQDNPKPMVVEKTDMDDSEEERVIVLNEDKKTNKKKKK